MTLLSKPRISALAVFLLLALTANPGKTQTKNIGIFTDEGSVGQTPPGGKASYDSKTGEYHVTGGGANIWEATDAFYFVWKRVSGDLEFSADVQFLGTSQAEHRKAVLMVRGTLDPSSAYADAASHGNGLTSLQFRGVAGEQTYQVFQQVDGKAHLRLVREGSRYTMFAGKPGEEQRPSGPVEYVRLTDPVYVGIGVCSHVATTLETAVFSNVKLDMKPAPPAATK